jgi:hypothetical protein
VKFNIPTKFYLDYQTCLDLDEEMGRVEFIMLISMTKVITIDEEAYHFLNTIVKEYNENIKDDDESE